MIFLYLFSYVLSLTGYLLGKAAHEELRELKTPVKYIINILIVIFYGVLTYLIGLDYYLIFFVVLFFIFLFSLKIKIFVEFHDLLLFAITFILMFTLFPKLVYLSLIPVIILFYRKSFEKFDIKKELYSFFIVILIYIFFLVFLN
jgi:hypothetical protein